MNQKSLKDYTIEDALKEHERGFAVICGDGKIKCITNLGEE
jgi:hypothetical protein